MKDLEKLFVSELEAANDGGQHFAEALADMEKDALKLATHGE
jgi:hypothetical protein